MFACLSRLKKDRNDVSVERSLLVFVGVDLWTPIQWSAQEFSEPLQIHVDLNNKSENSIAKQIVYVQMLKKTTRPKNLIGENYEASSDGDQLHRPEPSVSMRLRVALDNCETWRRAAHISPVARNDRLASTLHSCMYTVSQKSPLKIGP